jgi:hypothetical protein
MTKLENALEGHYEKTLEELPDDIRQWVERDLPSQAALGNDDHTPARPLRNEDIHRIIDASKVGLTVTAYGGMAQSRRCIWDLIGPNNRRSLARQRDMNCDPNCERAQQEAFESVFEIEDLKRQIAKWEVIPAPLPSERVLKETKLAELRQKLAAKESAARASRAQSRCKIEEVYPSLVAEIKHRRTRGQDHDRDTMINWMRGEYPEVVESRRDADKLYRRVPEELRRKKMGRPGGKAGAKFGQK